MKKVSLFCFLICLIIHTSCCEKKKSDDIFIESWSNIYKAEKMHFLGDKTYPSLEYFSKPFMNFEKKTDSLEMNFFSGNKEDLINEVYNSLPKDYFNWDSKEIDNFFNNVYTKEQLTISCLALKTLVLQRFSVLHKSATFEVTSIEPKFIRGEYGDKYYGRFIMEGRNRLQPLIVIFNNDTLPYLEDGYTPFIPNSTAFNRNERTMAKIICISWGDTLKYELEIKNQ